MPPEHEQLVSTLATILYFAKRTVIDYGTIEEKFQQVRNIVAKELRDTNPDRVGVMVLSACHRIIDVIDNRGLDQTATMNKIIGACQDALRNPKLGTISNKTWGEQIAGRANLMAKRTWPELRDW